MRLEPVYQDMFENTKPLHEPINEGDITIHDCKLWENRKVSMIFVTLIEYVLLKGMTWTKDIPEEPHLGCIAKLEVFYLTKLEPLTFYTVVYLRESQDDDPKIYWSDKESIIISQGCQIRINSEPLLP